MPQTVLVFYTRRPDLTPAEFEAYMVRHHVPLVKEIMGPHYPQSFTLRFAQRVESGAGDRLGATTSSKKRANADAPVVLVGSPDDLGWDAMGEMIFRDELHIQQAMATMNSPDGQKMKEDEEAFTDTDKLRVILMGACLNL
ncbi:hypothetical protein T440DRAFT_122730 [Plenodomus tracheiphilus IPT5]|uniref:EthD domain-containing protein n=1 Tax=Plenodomus tracheiphilus IPT5 TaxID=1408161 RepID=A0A6A7B4N0_9PLEO|nr:hypothetical protein T440DRAFT_122730 [Plenodomus tracheiphilus IPT5]